jgi:hypothetical protein
MYTTDRFERCENTLDVTDKKAKGLFLCQRLYGRLTKNS